MKITIEDFVQVTSLQAKALLEQQGVTTYQIGEVAFVCLAKTDKLLHVRNLFVAKTRRREGIGTQIFKTLEREAAKAGFIMIGLSLDVTRVDREGALAFTESLGLKVDENASGADHIGLLKFLPIHAVPALEEPPQSKGVGA